MLSTSSETKYSYFILSIILIFLNLNNVIYNSNLPPDISISDNFSINTT